MSRHPAGPSRDEKKIAATPSTWDRYLTMPVPEFLIASGIGRTTLYRLIGEGQIETATIGRRRLIVVESWRRLIERNRAGAEAA